MRLGYVYRDTAHQHSLDWWAKNGQDPNTTIYLIRSWAWSPWVQEAQQRLGHALHTQTTLDHRLKELAIVRVCTRNFSRYELYHHIPAALAAGLTREEIAAIQSFGWSESAALTAAQLACLQYVDEVDSGRGVQQETFDRLRAFLSEDQVVAITLQAGYWGCNARFTKALLVEDEPWMRERHTAARDHGFRDNEPMPELQAHPVPPRPAGSRIGLVSDEVATPKSREWFDRWRQQDGGRLPNLVRAWAWSPHVQATEQRLWEALTGEHTAIPPRVRALVTRRVSVLNYSPYLLALLEPAQRAAGLDDAALAAVAGDWASSPALNDEDRDLLRFVDAWDAGLGVTDTVFDAVKARCSRQVMVEIQLTAGFFGTQARFAKALDIALD